MRFDDVGDVVLGLLRLLSLVGAEALVERYRTGLATAAAVVRERAGADVGGAASIGGSAAGPCSCTGAASGSRAKRSARARAPCGTTGSRAHAATGQRAGSEGVGDVPQVELAVRVEVLLGTEAHACWAASVRPSVSDLATHVAEERTRRLAQDTACQTSRDDRLQTGVDHALGRGGQIAVLGAGRCEHVGSAYWFSAASPRSRP